MSPEQLKGFVLTAAANPWAKITGFLPNLFGMVIVLVVGYLISRGLQQLTTVVLRRIGFDSISSRVGLHTILDQAGIHTTAAEIVGHLVFWLFMLTFLISAVET